MATPETIDIRKMLRAADAMEKTGNHAGAVALYDRVAEHYASHGRHVHAVAISKRVLEMIDGTVPIVAPLYRHVWLRLVTSYESLHMQREADDARGRWEAMAADEAELRPRGWDRLN